MRLSHCAPTQATWWQAVRGAGRTGQAQIFLQSLDQPGTARGDADQARVFAHQGFHAAQQLDVERLGVRNGVHERLLRNCSRMMQADAASASRAPEASASVVL